MPNKPTFSCELWSINRWLRFTGWRLFVTADVNPDIPTFVGFIYYGFKGFPWRK